MAGPTAEEQLYIELTNETRLDPLGSAARYITSYTPLVSSDSDVQQAVNYFEVDGGALQAAFAALTPVGPVAWNEALGAAAAGHSAAMIAADEQSHQVAGEPDIVGRAAAVGYTGWTALGENVYAYSRTAIYGHAGFMVDWGVGPNGMQSPAGHRNNIMSANFREIGVDVTAELNPATAVGPQVVSEEFGARSGKFFVLGVAYTDGDSNAFYSIGEGRGDLTVQSGTASVTSAASGGYSLGVATGALSVTLSGGGLAGSLTVNTTIGSENIKLDVVNGNTLLSSGSIVVTGGSIAVLRALGVRGLSLTGGAGNQTVEGNAGNDTLAGGAGDDTIVGNGGTDTAVFSGARTNYTITAEGSGYRLIDKRSGANDGSDLALGVEQFQFADGIVAASTLILNAPPVAMADSVTAAEDTPVTIAVRANDTDSDGDTISVVSLGSSKHGAAVLNANGTITYTPAANFFGSDSFQYAIADGKGGTASATVTVTVTAVNDAPNAGNDSVRTAPNAAVTLPVLTNDADLDGDTLSIIALANPAHGTVMTGAGGTIVYTPDAGYAGADSFTYTVSDGHGGIDTATASIVVGAEPRFRMIGVDGFAGAVKGAGDVYGSNGFQDIAILAGSGRVLLDGSFARGGDIVRLEGAASAYTIALSGSSAVLSNGATEVAIPVGIAGLALVFDDGVRNLKFDLASNSARIGAQSFGSTTVAITAAADGTPLVSNANAAATAKVVLADGADVALAGKYSVFGSNGSEMLHLLDGKIALDGSFARGGDTVSLPGAAQDYSAHLTGSQVVLVGGGDTISIPVGTTGMMIDFLDDDRTLRFDVASSSVRIGDQTIAAVSEQAAVALLAPGSPSALEPLIGLNSQVFG